MLSSVGSVTQARAPGIAISVLPTNGFAFENVASILVISSIAKNGGKFEDIVSSEALDSAINAFLREPVVPEAIATIALSKQGDDRRQLMQDAFGLSRREPLVTGWLIADSGSQNDLSVF